MSNLLIEAVCLHQSGRVAEASTLYRRLLILQPDQPDALHLLGMIRRRTGDLIGGLTLIDWSLRFSPGPPGARQNLAGALADLESQAAATVQAALAHLQADRTGTAAAQCRWLLRAAPEHAGAAHLLGLAERRRGRPIQAAHWLRRALSLDPALAYSWFTLGSVLEGHDPNGAAAAHARAAALAPEVGAFWYALTGSRQRLADHAGALAACTRAIACGASAELYQVLGDLRHETGGDAVDAYREALALDPARGPAYVSLVRHLIFRHRPDDATHATLEALAAAAQRPTLAVPALRCSILLTDYSIFDRRVYAGSFALARAHWRRDGRDSTAFYVIAHGLYLKGRLAVLERLRARFLARFTADEIAADQLLRMWAVCQLGGAYYRRLKAMPPPEALVPPVAWRGPVAGFSGPVLFFSCDERYWSIYGHDLLASILERCSDPRIHVNVIDPTPETLARLDGWQAAHPDRINVTTETTDDRGLPYRIAPIRKIYFACVRFVRLAWLHRHYGVPMMMLDADCYIHDDLNRLLNELAGHDVGLFQAPEFGPTRECLAGSFYLGASLPAQRYADVIARYIFEYIAAGRAFWMLDQAALYCALHHLRHDEPGLAVVSITDRVRTYCTYDYRYDKQRIRPATDAETASP